MMNVVVMGAAGFIGTNLVEKLTEDPENKITAVDEKKEYFSHYPRHILRKIKIAELVFNDKTDFRECLEKQDIVYHLISTNIPATSNTNIGKELSDNIFITVHLLEACVKTDIEKVVFISSGGAVYGKEVTCPITETSKTEPITTYGIQKLTIEKLLYLYRHLYGLQYCIVRLSNPFGPFQRPNGQLGVITTFIYNALHGKKICVYGDGTIIRDYIYISDAVDAILNIVNTKSKHHIYNVGSGKGTTINEIIGRISRDLELPTEVEYVGARSVDVPVNYLDISRYEKEFGRIQKISLACGMKKTLFFLQKL